MPVTDTLGKFSRRERQIMDALFKGGKATAAEIQSFLSVMFGAGFETTADAMSGMLYWLATHPDDLQKIIADPQLIPIAVEEFLRWVSPIQIFGRNSTRDLEKHGCPIAKGGIVALGFGSANHDPSQFDEPEKVRFDRPHNRHLAFGAGPHLCLGAPVARMELSLTLELLTENVVSLAMQSDNSVAWKKRGDRRGLERLSVVLH